MEFVINGTAQRLDPAATVAELVRALNLRASASPSNVTAKSS
jgi:hypothetical protein